MSLLDGQVDHVVVPLDGSQHAERAITPALAIAQSFDAAVVFVTVVAHGDHREDGTRLLEEARERAGAPDAALEVAVGRPWAGIAASAHDHRPSVICMTSQGAGRLGHLVFGSVASSVVQGSEEPLVVVGPEVDVERGWEMDRVAALVDGSEASEAIVPTAVATAKHFGLTLNLVIVAPDEPKPLTPPPEDQLRWHEQRYIDELVARYDEPGLEVVGEVITDPIGVASGLRSVLQFVPHTLLAMTTSGRAGFGRVVHGSVFADAVRLCPVPVLALSTPDT